MGLFKKLFSKNKPRADNSTVGSRFSSWFGISASGKTVTEKSSMQIAAVYACVKVLAEGLAGLPVHLYEETEKGRSRAVKEPLYDILHSKPNPEMTSFIFFETLMSHLAMWGNAYAQIVRDRAGRIVSLYPLMPDKMTVDRWPKDESEHSGEIYYKYRISYGEKKDNEARTVILWKNDVLHVPGLGFDGLVGYSPIAMMKSAVGLSMAAEEYGSTFFANSARPSGVLEHPGIISDPDKLRDSWNSTFSGSENANKTAVLEEGVHYVPISVNPSDAQFLETRKFQINEIARIFRIPPHMIGDLEKSSFSNIEQQSLEFVKYTLEPWVRRWEQALENALLTEHERQMFSIGFNMDGLLRGDYLSRMNGYAVGRQNGWMSANDIRRLENLDIIPEDEGGELYLVNGNMVPIKNAGFFTDASSSTREGGEGNAE